MHLKKKRIYRPLPEEYTRVTNPERFRPLHGFALEILAQLRSAYDVVESETFESVGGVIRPIEYERPPVTLTPTAPKAAPISIAFTPFPSLMLRCGRWFFSSFPTCGCDACAETADRESERLEFLLNNVVSGQFSEVLEQPFFRKPWVRWSFGINDGVHDYSGGGEMLSPEREREIRAKGVKRMDWQPWPQRRA